MSQISRLHSAEITSGQIVDADDLNDEFNQLVNESNSQDTRLTTLESGTAVITGSKTFSGNVYVTGTFNLAKSSDVASPVSGDVWYNSTSDIWKANVAGSTYSFLGKGGLKAPSFTSAPTVVSAGNIYYDSTNDLIKWRSSSFTNILPKTYTTNPTTLVAGQLWYNNTSHTYRFYNGTSSQTLDAP